MTLMLPTLLLALLSPGTQAASFGGAGLGLAEQVDADGNELLLDIRLEPVKVPSGGREDVYGRMHLDFAFLADEDRIDRLDGTVLILRRGLEKGRVRYEVRIGDALWDQDDGLIELCPAGGLLDVMVAGEYVHLLVGADLYGRRRWVYYGPPNGVEGSIARKGSYALFLGVPLGLRVQTSASRPLGASIGVTGRPGIGLVSDERVIFDGDALATASYTLVQGEEMELVFGVSSDLHLDTWTSRGTSTVETLLGGLSVRF
jgi:hypothetical protein